MIIKIANKCFVHIKKQFQVNITKEYLQLEPIGLVFVFFFALILVIQFTAMLFHRFGTLSHILAATELNFCCNKKAEELSQDALIDKVSNERCSGRLQIIYLDT